LHGVGILRDLVVLVGVAIPVVAVAHRLGVPSVTGFLLAGLATGPYGLGLIARPESVAEIAELGVVLLLFTIGLELSLSRLLGLGRELFQGGGLQIGLTVAAAAGLGIALGVELPRGIFYGALVALSSTAILLKVYMERGELDAPHGRVVMALLLFQDLCVVPFMLLVPILAGSTAVEVQGSLQHLLLGLLMVAVLVLGGRLLVPRILDRFVLVRDRELFTICVLFLGLGAAFLTASFGLSLALGAFLAGLVLSESEYGLQALSDVLPFRDTFTGVFFTSIGMLLDLRYVLDHVLLVVAAVLAVLALKTLVTAVVVLSLGHGLVTSLIAGVSLAQVGEFSFVLAGVGASSGLFAPDQYQLFLAASGITLFATPALIAGARPLAEGLTSLLGWTNLWMPPLPEGTEALSDHAVIVGYGLSGRHLQRVLAAEGIAHVVLEQNGKVVHEARAGGVPIVFGDGTRREVLERVGVPRARVVVFVISSPADERRGIAMAHELAPRTRKVVRTRYVRAIDELMRLGATEVVVEEYEATIELFARVLEGYEVPTLTIHRELEAIRAEHYQLLRREERAPLALDALKHLGIHRALDMMEVQPDSQAAGQSPTSLELRRRTGAVVVAVVRDGQAIYRRDPSFAFRPGDIAVLVGDPSALDSAAALFRARLDAASRL
jgi:CPA2 family monovalent cation:H+ antiporter-2